METSFFAPAALELKEVGKGGRLSVGQLSNDNTSVKNQTASKPPTSLSRRIKKWKLDLQNKTGKYHATKKKQPLRKKVKPVHLNSWQQKEIQISNELNEWKYPEVVRDMHDSPVTLFEIFSFKYYRWNRQSCLQGNKFISCSKRKSFIKTWS